MNNSNQFNKDEELSLKLFIVLTRALQAIENQVTQNIKSYGLNLTEFGVLELLYHKGGQPIQKIGEKVLLASSSITYVVDKLEKKSYLAREACASDRRVTYAVITEAGTKLMDEIFPKHAKAMSEIMGGLSTEEKQEAIHHLKKLGLFAVGIKGE
ncbi:MarR family winged helix-turn-helix transcriptional regulator [Ornithinibacillus halotolerans]|uniref:MarR family transcriptional regulator n=1 Tax=Ornithinibacillus halotolerans TaxID=1274357 RepID=A0A916S203_9BACI|nr:MarR family transcriptional regulator [Ornithinibacillus halotolerans]GGA78343.1 MarR family transcriptional regulator [Ornithinibacillus halotolerans]